MVKTGENRVLNLAVSMKMINYLGSLWLKQRMVQTEINMLNNYF